MDVISVSSGGFWPALLAAEAMLTLNIALGLAIGELILALGVVERVFAPLVPMLGRFGIHEKIAAAMLLSVGSSRSAAALISGAYVSGDISQDEATFGSLSLAFPGYLRRWVGTAAMASGIAGRAGMIFALVLLFRSACRFAWVVALMIRRGGRRSSPISTVKPMEAPRWGERARRLFKILKRSLPWAWAFFALTYALVPLIDVFFTEHVAKWGFYSFIPAEGWAIAVSSLAHVTAALSSASGALARGSLGVGQAVLALLVGNMVGSVTRTMRQNVGYWVGIFPKDLIPGLLRWHFVTTLTLEAVSIFIVWFVAGVSVFG
jgi:hypothetical protein